jgi:hypothetical protein
MTWQVGTNRRKVLPAPQVINSVQMGEMSLSKSTYLSTKPHGINPDDSNFLSHCPEKDISHIQIEKQKKLRNYALEKECHRKCTHVPEKYLFK